MSVDRGIYLLSGPAGYRESFGVFIFGICFITQPVGRFTYCHSKARYSWNIFLKISPYKLPDCPVLVFLLSPSRDEGDLRAAVSWRRQDGKPLPSGHRMKLERRAGRLSISGIRFGGMHK